MKSLKTSLSFALTALALAAAPTAGSAAIIKLNDVLTNPSFEGAVIGGCPTGWTCTNMSVTNPTAAQYPFNPTNGLTSPSFVPDGNAAAFSPITGSTTGTLTQFISGMSFLAGNTYELEFWLGNPLGGLYPDRIDVQLLTSNTSGALGPVSNNLCDTTGRNSTLVSGVQSANDNGTQCLYSLNTAAWRPLDGDWRLYTLTFTTNVNIAGDIGVRFSVFPQQSAENGALAHLDLPGVQQPTTPVPEPVTLALLGAGLAGLAAFTRRSSRKNAREMAAE